MKTIWKIIITILIAISIIPIYNWYSGKTAPSLPDNSSVETNSANAYLAGGCFWCTESDFEKLYGVNFVVSGYMGGHVDSPTYNQITKGNTGHREMVKVNYDPKKITYQRLVFELLRETDPTDDGGSFFDRGHQYTSAVYYQSESEKQIALKAIQEIETRKVFDKPIKTKVEESSTFWVAEKYHQDFAKNSLIRYRSYRSGSGRDDFINKHWSDSKNNDLFPELKPSQNSRWKNYQKPTEDFLKANLTPTQYQITQEEGTEQPFKNEYWDNHKSGIYVDIVSREPLFSSTDKFDSGTGWPSFLKPIDSSFIIEKDDYKLLIRRTELRSKYADSHLGHIILDGPISNNKIRYCINSAALRFISEEALEKEGFSQYKSLFE